MKNRNLFWLVAIIVMVAANFRSANGQTVTPVSTTAPSLTSTVVTQSVLISSTKKYAVDSVSRAGVSNIYTWTLARTLPAPGAAVAGTDYVLAPNAATNNAVKNITWLTAGTFTITVGEANPAANGSCTDASPSVLTVTVAQQALIQFVNVTAFSGCNTASAITFPLENSNSGTINYPITVSYSLNGVAQTPISIASGLSLNIPSIGANATMSDIASAIVLTGITDAASTNYFVGATKTSKTYTAWATPQTSPISHD